MKKLIYQSWYNEDGNIPDYVYESVNQFKKYAEKHGADHIFLTDNYFTYNGVPLYMMNKLRMFEDSFFENYDIIVTVDTDMFIKNYNADVFQYNKGIHCSSINRRKDRKTTIEMMMNNIEPSKYKDIVKHDFFMSCVFIITKEFLSFAKRNFTPIDVWLEDYVNRIDTKKERLANNGYTYDEEYLKEMMNQHNLKYDYVDYRFYWPNYYTGYDNVYFLHEHSTQTKIIKNYQT